MKTLILGIAALLLTALPLQAQDATGTWQGTLQVGRPLRVVIKITNESTGLKAVLYSIDQGGQGVGASTVAAQGGTLKLAMPAMSATYEGKFGPGGNTIAGQFTQGGRATALELTRANADTAWAIPAPPAAMVPMAADAKPVFEVATIKPSEPDRPGKAFTVQGRQIRTINTTAADLVTMAYGIHAGQISGAPNWFESEKFDILGTPDISGVPNQEQLRGLIQHLMADRFKLTFHRDKKELPVYALRLGPKGPSLTKSEATGNLPGLFFRGPGVLPARNATMGDFAGIMQNAVMDRPVVDQTGLSGRFDFTLTWTPDETQFRSSGIRVPPPPADGSGPPGLFTAIQEQLGLKFETTRAPVDVIVIDRIEKPSPD